MPSSRLVTAVLLPLCALACGQPGAKTQEEAQLARFRAALPSASKLEAAAPGEGSGRAITAFYPQHAAPLVLGINGAVGGMIAILEVVTSFPPTVYNSETKEYVWGPWENDDGVGYVAAYIRENPEGADFKYSYAFLRGIDNDLAKLAPVISGAATPDPDDEDNGVGLTLWDFEANYAFEAEYNPDADLEALDRGRFIALYGRGPAEDNPEATFGFVVALFRAFVSKDNPTAPAADIDYFYGRYQAEQDVRFLDFRFPHDFEDDGGELAEDVQVRLAFLGNHIGRAEARAWGGDLNVGQVVHGTECWDESVQQTYFELASVEGDTSTNWVTVGEPTNCASPFTATLDELQIPSLDTLYAEEPEIMSALDTVARTGEIAE